MNLTYAELVKGVKQEPKHFLASLAFKGSVSFSETDPFQLPRRTIIALAVLLVGNWRVQFYSSEGQRTYYFPVFPWLIIELLWEATQLPIIQSRHKRRLKALRLAVAEQGPRKLKKIGGKLLYLRTDMLGQTREGGSFTHVAGFIAGASRNGWETHLVACGQLPNHAKQLEIVRYSPYINYSMECGEMDYSARLTRKLWRRRQPACIYQRHSGFNLTGLELAHHWRVPFVLELNNLEVWIRKNWGTLKTGGLLEETERILLDGADLIIVVSEVLKDDLVTFGVAPEKILVNPNGVEEDIFVPEIAGSTELRTKLGFKVSDVIVGFLGSFGVWHGVPVLAEAIPTVRDKAKNIKFLLIGDGELRTEIERKLKTFTKEGSVIFTGRISHQDAPKYLASCDIFASPHVQNADGTRFFGSPTKLFEYMAMERPIIASDLEQIGEILENDKDAILTKPGDAYELAAGIVALSRDPERRRRLAGAARRKALRRYTWQSNADRSFRAILQKK